LIDAPTAGAGAPFAAEELLEIGHVGKPHGLHGELRLVLHNPHGDALDHVERLVLEIGGKQQCRTLISVRGATLATLVSLEGVESRNDADVLKGAKAYVVRAELPELDPAEYYLSDLVGAEVIGPEGSVGHVVEVALHPTVECVVIRDPAGKRLEQPLLEPWVEAVDVKARQIRLSSLDGLIE
jgi:16S rRNA processing protein RimM